MRTTVTIDDELLTAAKRRAIERGVALRAVIEDALRMALSRPDMNAPSAAFRPVTFKGDGLRPGVNIDRWSEVLETDDPWLST